MLLMGIVTTLLLGLFNLALVVLHGQVFRVLDTPDEPRFRVVALGDVDGDGDLDALLGTQEVNKIWLNDGQGNFQWNGQRLGVAGDHVALGDVDGDGDVDAFVGHRLWLNDGRGVFGERGRIVGQSLKADG